MQIANYANVVISVLFKYSIALIYYVQNDPFISELNFRPVLSQLQKTKTRIITIAIIKVHLGIC